MTIERSGEEYAWQLSSPSPLKRIDQLLAETFPEQSRTYFQKLIDQDLVLVNHKTVKKRHVPSYGDWLSVTFQLTPEISLEPEEMDLEILYEDEEILCINKPAGLVVHPAPGHWSGTLVHGLLSYLNLEKLPEADSLRPGLVHRLDKDTSGLILIAKTPQTHRGLIEQFSQRQVQKDYLAICVGKPKELYIEGYLGRDPRHRKQQAFVEEERGRWSETSFSIVTHQEQFSLVKAYPKTGRTHQIRVHLKALRAPILGDPIYGSPSANQRHPNTRLQLHAFKLQFKHPTKGVELKLSAPLPHDMKQWISKNFSGSVYESLSSESEPSDRHS